MSEASFSLALSDRAFDSPAGSLIPFLAYWAKPRERLSTLRTDFGGEKELDRAEVHFEYGTASRVPHHAAFTDLMTLAPKTAVAFSGRWTEPMTESIAKWRVRRPPAQAKAIVDGWFEAVARVTHRRPVAEPGDDSLVYETVQQVASLCATRRPRLHLVYQLFGGWHEREYEAALSALTERLGKRERLAIWLQTVPLAPSAHFDGLKRHWRDLPPASRVFELRELLADGKAFQFGEANWLRFL